MEGEVVSVTPPPPEPFPDEFTIAYPDGQGQQRKAVFKRSDLYTLPKVGEKVEMRFLSDAPEAPLGPARVRDAAAERFIPWGIGIVVGYFVVQLAVSFANGVWRRARIAD